MQEITFEKDGFIGIFDNVFEDDYIDQLIKFFESKEGLNLVQNSSVHNIPSTDRDMDEMHLVDPMSMQRVP